MLPSPTDLALRALNHMLGQAPWARGRLQAHSGCRATLTLPPFSLQLRVTPDGCFVADAEGEPDVHIELPADTPFRALRGGIGEAVKAAQLSGSADFADALGFVLRNLRWDAEEDLSRVVGDVAARRLVGSLGSALRAQQDKARRLGENLAEYAIHEAPVAVGKAHLDAFSTDLAALRQQLAQLELRTARLAPTSPAVTATSTPTPPPESPAQGSLL